MTLSLEAKKWLLNERKRQQNEDDKMKTSLALIESTVVPNDKETNNSNIPNQYSLANKILSVPGDSLRKGNLEWM
jgi:hypothetical protein